LAAATARVLLPPLPPAARPADVAQLPTAPWPFSSVDPVRPCRCSSCWLSARNDLPCQSADLRVRGALQVNAVRNALCLQASGCLRAPACASALGWSFWRMHPALTPTLIQVVMPAARPAPTAPPLGLDVVVRWHRE